MAYLIDTNVLVRLANSADASHAVATHAVLELHRRGEELRLTPQVLIEFRSVATRPTPANGLGLTTAEAEILSTGFETSFPLLEETFEIYTAWKDLVSSLGVTGKQVHDARLVAVCHAQVVTHLLTFNMGHFARMAGHGPGLTVIDPANI